MTSESAADTKSLTNVPEMSVSELSFSLKRTLEDTFGRVRVRGELSRVTVARSGHMYSDLKDENAVLNVICWKGNLGKLAVTPEEGLDVICTGRITSYEKRSSYQLIIESMELAGEGALLKMLEERRKKLAAEGLFAEERKKPLPFLPQTVGVVTSQTGAVIRDILHRLADRFPRHVMLWPVSVQGDGAADMIAAGIRGFDSLPADGPVPRPDVLIVARGGGSLEDLMAFNEEIVVRAAADCTIPLISAVGHETDTTLIDYAADRRAPTPTGAAEIAVPRRLDLLARVAEGGQRLTGALDRYLANRHDRLTAQAARLGRPERLLEVKTQTLDHLTHKLSSSFDSRLSARQSRVAELGAKLRHPRHVLAEKERTLSYYTDRLTALETRLLTEKEQKLANAGKLLDAYSYNKTLERGFVVVRDADGAPVTEAAATRAGQAVKLEFSDKKDVDAVIGKNPGSGKASGPPSKPRKNNPPPGQEELF